MPADKRETLYRSVLEESVVDPEYLTMLGLAALIALLGLLQNSAAVIIGAMLISPLMNPILSAALALTLGDGPLGKRSAAVLGFSIAGAIAITWAMASLVPLKQSTPEILARTNPNLLDMGIAVLSGLAGTLALRSRKASLMIIPGVAIAVAVIPPLAVVGYAISNRLAAPAWGGFLLFVTNLVSIIISAAVVFLLMGFRPHWKAEEGRLKLKYRLAISAGVLLILSIPLVQTLRNAVVEFHLRSEIQSTLNQAFQTEHSSVTDLNYSRQGPNLVVRATLRTTEYFDNKQIEFAQQSLRKILGSDARLEIDQLLVAQGGLTPQAAARIRNFISGGVIQPAPGTAQPPFDFKSNQEKLLAFLRNRVDETLTGTPFKRVGQLRAQLSKPLVLGLDVTAPEALQQQTVNVLASQLAAKLSLPVELHGRTWLQGAPYNLSVETDVPTRGLSVKDRQAVRNLVELALKQPDLHLQVTVSASNNTGKDAQVPLVARQIRALLTQSRLQPARWTMGPALFSASEAALAAPKKEAADSSTGGAPRSAPTQTGTRCDFKTFQEF